MLNSENTMTIHAIISSSSSSTMHILLKEFTIPSYERIQRAIIMDLDLVQFELNIRYNSLI